MSKGVIYSAVGKRFADEAAFSARSLKVHHPGWPITLFTDTSPDDDTVFTEVRCAPRLHPAPHISKLFAMRDTPYEETLFLDTDTFICSAIDAIFDALAGHDMVAAREYSGASSDLEVDVPDSVPELNLGVFAYRHGSGFENLVDSALQWAEDCHAKTGTYPYDQPAFRYAHFRSRLRLATLKPEYNCRFATYGEVAAPVRILHGRIPGQVADRRAFEDLGRRINADVGPRVFVAGRLIALDQSMRSWIGTNRARELPRLFGTRRLMAANLLRGLFRRARRGLRRP